MLVYPLKGKMERVGIGIELEVVTLHKSGQFVREGKLC